MAKYVAALFANNRAVSGLNHGDAFSKLSTNEKNGDIESGFIDVETGKFFSDNLKVYLKQVYLLRHGDATGQHHNDKLTDLGVIQSHVLAETIEAKNISEFEFFSSPYLRCKQTAQIIEEKSGLKFCAKDCFRKQDDEEKEEHFLERIISLIDSLPEKSVVVTHTDIISNIIYQMMNEQVCCVPHCSISYISSRELIILENSGRRI